MACSKYLSKASWLGQLPWAQPKTRHFQGIWSRTSARTASISTTIEPQSSIAIPLSRSRLYALVLLAGRQTRYLHSSRTLERWSPAVGSEPGIDDDAQALGSYKGHSQKSEIKIIDYSATEIVQHSPPSSSLSEYLRSHKKPEWAACRWVYVNGLDLDVIKSLAGTKMLHRLAIEDVVHTSSPSKVDWYNDHAFIIMTLQSLTKLGQHGDEKSYSGAANPSAQFSHESDSARVEGSTRHGTIWPSTHQGFAVTAEQVSIFLTADHTVITIFEHSGHEVLTPILALLESAQTIVRSSNDPSMLVHAVIDTIVDLYLPIAKAFGAEFQDLEQAVLIAPTIAQSRQLYALRSELTRLRDNIVPIGSVVGMLRDHCAVVHPEAVTSSPGTAPAGRPSIQLRHDQMPESAALISPLAHTYLADVQDHVRVLESGTHASIRSAENLTSLIFNTVTAKQNESVRQLTVVSIFFLPLTFLTGEPVDGRSRFVHWYTSRLDANICMDSKTASHETKVKKGPIVTKQVPRIIRHSLVRPCTINYQRSCANKNLGVINAIGKFCQNDSIVVPSKHAGKGQQGHVDDSWANIQITGDCNPPQWVPSKYCLSQFQEICAKGDKDGAGSQTFGRDGCQTWTIYNGRKEPEGFGALFER
nr:cobalt/magnesium transport protein cora [Quercus suber]